MFSDSQPIGITVIGSGSKGNATIIHSGKDAILVDAGFSKKEFLRRLSETGLPQDLQFHAILVTHEHTDHVNGLRLVAQKLNAPIFTTSRCADFLKCHCKIDTRLNLIAAGGSFDLAGASITPFSIPHDAVDPVAYVVVCGHRKIGIATDLGNANTLVAYELQDCDALVIESNHDLNMLAASQRPWPLKQRIMGNMGHLSNVDTTQLLERVANPHLRHVILAHLSSECNTEDLAFQATRCCLEHLGRQDINLAIARQDSPLATVWL